MTKISELPTTVLPSRLHALPAERDGNTVQLTAGQIADLNNDDITAEIAAMGATKQDLDAVLTMIAALTAAANKVLWFSDGSTAALADFATKGRDIAAATDMAALLAKLGPVLGGPAPVPSAAGLSLSDGNFNNIAIAGVYTTTDSWSNGPLGTATHTGILEVLTRGAAGSHFVQTWYKSTGEVYMRSTDTALAGTWPNAWIRIDKPVFGTNANGSYLLFADGSMICGYSFSAGQDITTAAGSLFVSSSGTWTYPVTPVGTPRAWAIPANIGRWATVNAGETTASFRSVGTASSATLVGVDLICLGRWL